MAKEGEANEKVEELTPRVEPEITETEPDVNWKAKYEEVLAKTSMTEAEFENLKQSHASVQRELQKERERKVSPEMFEGLAERLKSIEKYQELMLDHSAGTAELTPEIRAQIAKASEEQRQQRIADESEKRFVAVAKKAGLDDPTIEKIKRETSGPAEGIARVAEVILEKQAEAEVKAQAKADEEAAIGQRKKLEEAGELKVEVGGAGGGSGSWVNFEKAFIEGKVSLGEYEERARKEGKL